RGQCEVSLFEHCPGGERYMTERALNAPAFQGQRFANACQARNAVLALALAEAGGFGSGSSRCGAVPERYMAALAPRLCFPGRDLAAEGDREPRAAEAPGAALFPALDGGACDLFWRAGARRCFFRSIGGHDLQTHRFYATETVYGRGQRLPLGAIEGFRENLETFGGACRPDPHRFG